jgi:hypothetical protein
MTVIEEFNWTEILKSIKEEEESTTTNNTKQEIYYRPPLSLFTINTNINKGLSIKGWKRLKQRMTQENFQILANLMYCSNLQQNQLLEEIKHINPTIKQKVTHAIRRVNTKTSKNTIVVSKA